MDAALIRDELRTAQSSSLRRRRRIIALSAVGIFDFAIISLYQTGVIRSLPDLPGRVFDSNRVNASEEAYALGVPDGITGAAMYTATMLLAAAGGSRRSGRSRVLDVLLGGAVAVGVGAAAKYLVDMITVQKRACPYCLVGGAVSAAMVPAAYREVRDAVTEWRS